MLSLDFICQHPATVRDALRRRGDTLNIDVILHLAEQRRELITRTDQLYASLKQLKEQMNTTPASRRVELNQQIKAVTGEIRKFELQNSEIETHLHFHLLRLPNLPHASVQSGDMEVYRWGEPVSFSFEPVPHWDLGERLGIMSAEMGTKIAGSRFVTLLGLGARLERALISFMLDVHTRDHGYTEVAPPYLAKGSVMLGAGQLPKFEDQVYACTADDLYLNPTAEVPLIGMHSDAILLEEKLPLRYAALTAAFRREAGSAARHNRGLLRLHQFDKVELFQYVTPQESFAALSQMLQHAETILQQLELSYRVIALGAAQLPFSAAKTFDIEVWMPGLSDYVEISSISNCETFQARRANIKYRSSRNARTAYVHTLNGSGLAIGRTMAAILETYQQVDGTVIVPKVLRPYMGTSLLASF